MQPIPPSHEEDQYAWFMLGLDCVPQAQQDAYLKQQRQNYRALERCVTALPVLASAEHWGAASVTAGGAHSPLPLPNECAEPCDLVPPSRPHSAVMPSVTPIRVVENVLPQEADLRCDPGEEVFMPHVRPSRKRGPRGDPLGVKQTGTFVCLCQSVGIGGGVARP